MPRALKCLLVLVIFLSGCVTTMKQSQVQDKLMGVDKSDGVGREEAILIAQDFLFKNSAQDNWQVDKPRVRNSGDFWSVNFASKHRYSLDFVKSSPLTILVMKANGKIPENESDKIQY